TDPARAVSACHQLAEQGVALGQDKFGSMYATGQGVPLDFKEAVKWFRKAADQGYANAQYNLGVAYFEGSGVPQDFKEAVKWFRKAADQGNDEAQFNLAVMYDTGQDLPQDYKSYSMPSGSMKPTLRVGDSFMAATRTFDGRPPLRGDVVVFKWPEDGK